MPRISRVKSNTGIYHIIFRGINKQIIFEDSEDKSMLIYILKRYRDQIEYEVYSYCIMDNHVHILFKEGNEDLAVTMKRVSVSYVNWYNTKYERSGHLFQGRYISEPVNDDKYLLTVLRYIHQNPLKAGMVSNIHQYKWSSHHEYIGKENLADTNFILSLFSTDKNMAIKKYAEFVSQPEDWECLDIRGNIRLNDSEALDIIKKCFAIESMDHIQKLNRSERDNTISRLKMINGLSIRQISRLTGIAKNVVERA